MKTCLHGFQSGQTKTDYENILRLLGHCIATWYAMSRYLELRTCCGRGDAVTVLSYNSCTIQCTYVSKTADINGL